MFTGLDLSDTPTVFMSINVSNGTVVSAKGMLTNVHIHYYILLAQFLTKNYSNPATTIWASRKGKQPLVKPICGYTGTECPQNMTIYILIGGGLILFFLCGTILGIVLAIRSN
jgi:hypothetical protein